MLRVVDISGKCFKIDADDFLKNVCCDLNGKYVYE